MHLASKLKLEFNVQTLTFTDVYPKRELEGVMTEQEFQGVLFKINDELAVKLHKNSKEIRKWFRIVGIGALFIVGLFLLPVLLHKSSKQSKLLLEFHDEVKDYLYRINKKKYLKRKIEWKLIKDKKRSRGKDAVNPESQMRLEIIYESSSSLKHIHDTKHHTFAMSGGPDPWVVGAKFIRTQEGPARARDTKSEHVARRRSHDLDMDHKGNGKNDNAVLKARHLSRHKRLKGDKALDEVRSSDEEERENSNLGDEERPSEADDKDSETSTSESAYASESSEASNSGETQAATGKQKESEREKENASVHSPLPSTAIKET